MRSTTTNLMKAASASAVPRGPARFQPVAALPIRHSRPLSWRPSERRSRYVRGDQGAVRAAGGVGAADAVAADLDCQRAVGPLNEMYAAPDLMHRRSACAADVTVEETAGAAARLGTLR
jgi:hypothetical protein